VVSVGYLFYLFHFPVSAQWQRSSLPGCYAMLIKYFISITGQPAKFNVSMRTPEDFPVDLYYLMDLSGFLFQTVAYFLFLKARY